MERRWEFTRILTPTIGPDPTSNQRNRRARSSWIFGRLEGTRRQFIFHSMAITSAEKPWYVLARLPTPTDHAEGLIAVAAHGVLTAAAGPRARGRAVAKRGADAVDDFP